jgi:thymidylate synthase
MKSIVAKTPGVLWRKAAREVYTQGSDIKDGEKNLKELLNVYVTCEKPNKTDATIETLADKEMIEWMLNNFLKQDPVLDWGYSYGKRFFNHHGINQVENIINKLKKNPDSKSATINLMDVKEDQKHVPCICTIDFKMRSGILNATAFFRSQDAGKKLYADIISIGRIMDMIASGVGAEVGQLNILISSLHVYDEDLESKVLPLINS